MLVCLVLFFVYFHNAPGRSLFVDELLLSASLDLSVSRLRVSGRESRLYESMNS